MTQIMQSGRRDSVRNDESKGADQGMEDLTGGPRMHAAAAVEGEQGCVGIRLRMGGPSPLDLGTDHLGDTRAVRDEATFPELATSHDQHSAIRVDVAQAQPADLARAQTESVAESEDDVVRGTALAG